ncbi:MAG: adenylosuccinate synthase [Phycisphaeraceae bacterium]|nr:adenylosuccinate synthase [Phycisphaeraceae bacterium]MCW5762980.1 adenylosuccinate synthase [Phycisphaeraceae bacterium]
MKSDREHASTAVIGLQWGDEGKGKLVDVLGRDHDAVVRYNGGANAGHSIVIGGERFAVHLIPVGVFLPGVLAVIGNGVVIDPETLVRELEGLEARGIDTSGLRISSRAHIVMPYHKLEDAAREERAGADGKAIGTTRRGIGPAYADKAQRRGAIRVIDLLDAQRLRERVEEACRIKSAMFPGGGEELDPKMLIARLGPIIERLRAHVCDTTYLLHDLLAQGRRLLFEGANATLLDVDHGTYPYVTASNASALGIPAGTGVPMSHVSTIIGVAKAYSTRVGAGAMPTEQVNALGDRIRERGREYGTTTGRPRRVGWIDLVALRYAAMINGITHLGVTLLDVLEGLDELHLCVGYRTGGGVTNRFLPDGRELARVEAVYETMPGFFGDISGARQMSDLPKEARNYLTRIEEFVGVPIGLVSVGPDRSQIVDAAGILGARAVNSG